jgi:hypothetical protein
MPLVLDVSQDVEQHGTAHGPDDLFRCAAEEDFVHAADLPTIASHDDEVHLLQTSHPRNFCKRRSFGEGAFDIHALRIVRFQEATRIQPGVMAQALLLCPLVGGRCHAQPIQSLEAFCIDHMQHEHSTVNQGIAVAEGHKEA